MFAGPTSDHADSWFALLHFALLEQDDVWSQQPIHNFPLAWYRLAWRHGIRDKRGPDLKSDFHRSALLCECSGDAVAPSAPVSAEGKVVYEQLPPNRISFHPRYTSKADRASCPLAIFNCGPANSCCTMSCTNQGASIGKGFLPRGALPQAAEHRPS